MCIQWHREILTLNIPNWKQEYKLAQLLCLTSEITRWQMNMDCQIWWLVRPAIFIDWDFRHSAPIRTTCLTMTNEHHLLSFSASSARETLLNLLGNEAFTSLVRELRLLLLLWRPLEACSARCAIAFPKWVCNFPGFSWQSDCSEGMPWCRSPMPRPFPCQWPYWERNGQPSMFNNQKFLKNKKKENRNWKVHTRRGQHQGPAIYKISKRRSWWVQNTFFSEIASRTGGGI